MIGVELVGHEGVGQEVVGQGGVGRGEREPPLNPVAKLELLPTTGVYLLGWLVSVPAASRSATKFNIVNKVHVQPKLK